MEIISALGMDLDMPVVPHVVLALVKEEMDPMEVVTAIAIMVVSNDNHIFKLFFISS